MTITANSEDEFQTSTFTAYGSTGVTATFTVNYTRVITVYTPAERSYNGQEIVHGTFDGNSTSEIQDCVTRWDWNASSKSAIQQAAKSPLTFQTELVDTTSGDDGSGGTGDTTGDDGSDDTTTTVTRGSITVLVLDADTDAPISGVYVSGAGKAGNTGSNGKLLFKDIPVGTHSFSASKTGYKNGSGSGTITAANPTVTVTIYLKKIDDVIVDESGSGSVTVYVRDADTSALLSSAYISGNGYGGYTNSSGSVGFSDMSYGTYTFTASKSGYESGSGSITVNSTGTVTLTIYLDPEIILPKNGDITIYVRDKVTGTPIANANIDGNGGNSGTTNASGTITFEYVPLGSYTFTATKDGYDSASETASITIYLEKNKADVGIMANAINGTVCRGSTIMVAATVTGDSRTDFTPTLPLTVTMKATRNGGTVFDTQTKSVICPKSQSNLVWFAVEVPISGYTGADVTFTFDVSTPSTVTECLIVGYLLFLSIYDIRHRKVPNDFVIGFVPVVLLKCVALLSLGIYRNPLPILLGSAAGFAILLDSAMITHGGIGGGDIKLAAVLGLASDLRGMLILLCAASVLAVVYGMGFRYFKKEQKLTIPFVPFMLVGYILAIAENILFL